MALRDGKVDVQPLVGHYIIQFQRHQRANVSAFRWQQISLPGTYSYEVHPQNQSTALWAATPEVEVSLEEDTFYVAIPGILIMEGRSLKETHPSTHKWYSGISYTVLNFCC